MSINTAPRAADVANPALTLIEVGLGMQSRQLKKARAESDAAFQASFQQLTQLNKTQESCILQLRKENQQLRKENQQLRIQAKQEKKVFRAALRVLLQEQPQTVIDHYKTYWELTPSEKADVEQQFQRQGPFAHDLYENARNYYQGTPDSGWEMPTTRTVSSYKPIPVTKPNPHWVAFGHLLEGLDESGMS